MKATSSSRLNPVWKSRICRIGLPPRCGNSGAMSDRNGMTTTTPIARKIMLPICTRRPSGGSPIEVSIAMTSAQRIGAEHEGQRQRHRQNPGVHERGDQQERLQRSRHRAPSGYRRRQRPMLGDPFISASMSGSTGAGAESGSAASPNQPQREASTRPETDPSAAEVAQLGALQLC